MKPLVTIAIPIYNPGSYLRDSIQSVINQTNKDWILYLINDGSTDESLCVMQEYAQKDHRIKNIDDGQNKGLIARLNQSVQLCETKYYARMDADDIMCINRIEEQVAFLESHPDVDVCGTSIMTIDDNNNIVGSGFYEGKVSGFVHPTVMGKTEWFKRNPYADWAERCEDFELWTRTRDSSVFYAIGKPLLFYREFGIASFRKTCKSLNSLIRVYCNYKQYNKSFLWCMKNCVISYFKIAVYAIFNMLGKMDFVISKRSRRPIPEELRLGEGDLRKAIMEG